MKKDNRKPKQKHKHRLRCTWARVRRFGYLLFRGMWRGECAIVVYDCDGLATIASGAPIHSATFKNYRVWWKREA